MMDPPPNSAAGDAVEPPPQSILRRLINLDTALSLHLHTITQPLIPRSLLQILELSGDGRFFFPVTISLLLSPLSTSSPLLSIFLFSLLLGSVLDLLLVGLTKHLVRRSRPVYNKGMHLVVAVDHWSFPSGHSSRVCFIAGYFYLCSAEIREVLMQLRSNVGEYGSEKVGFFVSIVWAWAASTSVSRVLLGRHFVFDVVAGACLGVLEALIVFHCLKY